MINEKVIKTKSNQYFGIFPDVMVADHGIWYPDLYSK